MRADLVGVSLCVEAGHACYIPLAHKEGEEGQLFGSDELTEGQIGLEQCLSLIKPLLEDPSVMKDRAEHEIRRQDAQALRHRYRTD